MTDEQYKMLRSIQFAQLALLQSIDANIRQLVRQEDPASATGVSLSEARAFVDKVMAGRGQAAR